MHLSMTRTAMIAALLVGIAVQQAGAQATLNYNGFSGSTILNTNGVVNWSMTTYTPMLQTNNAGNPTAATSPWYAAAFNNQKPPGWTLNFINNTAATLTIQKLNPTLTPGGFGDLKFQLGLSYPAGTVTGGPPNANPTPINGPWGPNNAVWTQSVSTNDPLVGNATSTATPGSAIPGMRTYLDLKNGTGNSPPAYPYQYNGSLFYDDPSRQGVVGQTIYWYGDAMLSTINRQAKTINVYADVLWGFQITGVQPNNIQNIFASGDDLGTPLNNAVTPEPAPTAALALGLIGLTVRRRKRKL